jgi:transcriptional regulator of acetoin/glycerol metabolism
LKSPLTASSRLHRNSSADSKKLQIGQATIYRKIKLYNIRV